MTSRLPLIVTLLVVAAGAGRLSAQQPFEAVGPNECLNCHDHDAERQWYEKKEIPEVQRLFADKGGNAGHINSLKQLEAPKSKEFAEAIGLADKYDMKGACVSCHATVFAGDANAGVSCESCHGAGSGYLKPHQTKDAYELSVSRYGMTKLVGNIQGWTQQCTNCHVMNDERLIKAGHPAGDDFDLGKKYQPVSIHFKKKYDPAQVSGLAGPEMANIIRRRRPNAVPTAAPVPTAPAPTPVAETANAPAATPPAAVPPPAPAQTAQATQPLPAPKAPAAPAAKKAAPKRAPAAPAPASAAPVAPVMQVADAAAPPPGSPTSIEPPPPLAPVAAPAAVAPPAAPVAVSVPAAASSGFDMRWLAAGGVALLLVGAFVLLRKK